MKRFAFLFSESMPYIFKIIIISVLFSELGLSRPCSVGSALDSWSWVLRFDPCRRQVGFLSFRWDSKKEVPCHSGYGTLKTPYCSMAVSAEHRPNFAAIHRQYWRLHMSERFLSGTFNNSHLNTVCIYPMGSPLILDKVENFLLLWLSITSQRAR